jgi:hypothetical protein
MFMILRLFPKMIQSRRHPALLFVVALLGASCGPELTTPAATDVSGAWTSPGPAAGLTDVSIQLDQSKDGSITGTYIATGRAPTQFCPAAQSCQISGAIAGTNTVLEVYFELKDAGQFSGQLIDGVRLRGSMARINSIGTLEFTRVINTTPAAP